MKKNKKNEETLTQKMKRQKEKDLLFTYNYGIYSLAFVFLLPLGTLLYALEPSAIWIGASLYVLGILFAGSYSLVIHQTKNELLELEKEKK